jgi:Rrf2 family protein
MLQLTMTGEYSVRAMLHLASKPSGAVVQIGEISKHWDIPEEFLRKIVQILSKSGLILSHRGAGGGVELAKPAEEISLLEVIEAAEGKLALNKCLLKVGACPRDAWCAVHQVWSEAQQEMKAILRSKSLAELVAQSAARRQLLRTKKSGYHTDHQSLQSIAV